MSYMSGSSPGPTPHPRIYLPLLSFFASLLSLDSETVHLLQHTPMHSILFPGASSSTVGDNSEAEIGSDRPRGVETLFAPPSERLSLKEGIKVACNTEIALHNPFLVSSAALTNIAKIVKGLVWRRQRWQTLVWSSDHNTDD